MSLSDTIVFKNFLPNTFNTLEKNKPTNLEWYKKALDDFKNNKNQKHIAKCPGINSIVKTGWIQKTYQDIVVTTNGDKKSFKVEVEIDQAKGPGGDCIGNYVNFITADVFSKFKPANKFSMETLIKIQSPWIVYIPEGYKLLVMPVAYSDQNLFTSTTGLLKGMNFLNVQLFWHNLNGTQKIKKGTPLSQYILVKDIDVKEEYKLADKKDFEIYMKSIQCRS